jgi:tetratricopeptide (TPR) repeat protein
MSIEVQYLKILLADARDGEAKIVADKIKSSNPNAAVLVAAGRILLEYDQYPAAKQMLEAADTANGSVNVKLDLAIAEFHIHGPSSGFNALDAVPAAERTGDYYLARAEMLDAAGRFPEAVADLNQALREAPKRPQFYRDAVFFLIKNDRAPEAINLLDQAVRIAPYDPEILLLKATTLELAKKTEESERLLDQIESRWPEWYNVWLTHGIILETYKRYDEARQMIETAVALGARTSETYFYLSESTYYSAPDKLDAAEAAIKTALELAPQDPWSRALAGRIALDKHDYAEAIDQLQKAVKLAPHLVQAHYYMSQAYKALGNTTQAQAELKEVALINKDFPNAGNEVGDLRERLFSVKAPQN